MGFQKMVHDHNGNYVELKVGAGNIIYINSRQKMKDGKVYKVGGDGYIYSSGAFISKDSVPDFCRSQGFIKWTIVFLGLV